MNLFSVLVCRQVQSKCSCSFFPGQSAFGPWILLKINDRHLTFSLYGVQFFKLVLHQSLKLPFLLLPMILFESRASLKFSNCCPTRRKWFPPAPPAHNNVNYAVFRLNNVTHSARSDRIDMLVLICKGSISRAGVGPASWAKRILELEKTMTRN